MNISYTDNLLRSELKKARKYAEKRDKSPRMISGWFTDSKVDELGVQIFKLEILDEAGERMDDVQLNVFLPDRRKTWAGEVAHPAKS